MGKVQHIGRNYLLPSAEAEDVVFTATTEPVNLEFIATTTGPAELVINSEVEAIVAELHESERDTTNPSRFEEAVARCFHFLGFEAKHIGGAGKADVLLRASLGSASYTVVIDAKTANGDVPDQRIDWLTLDEHKAKNKAQYCIVVGPSFKSDRVQQRAIGSGVTLFSTSMLEDIIRLHDSTPFDMIQLEDLFKEKGNPTNWRDDLNEYAASATLDYEAFTSIVQLLRDENLRGKERTAEQLEAVLEAKDVQCTEEQVSSILKFLELPPLNAVKKDKNGKYVIPISPETLVKKLERIQDSISSIKISSVS